MSAVFFSSIASASDKSSMNSVCVYFACVMHCFCLHFASVARQTNWRIMRGILGRKDAPLYLTMKKKIPRNAPCGVLPGNDLGLDCAPLYDNTMDLPDRYEVRIRRSQAGTCSFLLFYQKGRC